MKKLLMLVVAVAAMVSASPLMAQQGYALTNMTLAYTSVATNSTSNTLTAVISSREWQEVGVSIGLQMDKTNAPGSGATTAVTFNFGTSAYATTNFSNSTNSFIPVVIYPQGNTIVWANTNLYVGSQGWIGLINTVNNNTNGSATNITIRYTVKKRRFSQ